MFDPREVAKVRMAWWKKHHEKDWDEVTRLMALECEMTHNLDPNVATKMALPMVEAAKEHDLAEKEGISEEESQLHWDKGLEFMTRHFEMLNEAVANDNFRKYVSAVVQTKRGQV